MLAQLLIRLAAARGHLVLGGILLVAAGLRFWGLSFGLPHDHCRPDENLLVHHALSIGAGDLNPHAFYWPTLHFYLLALVFGVYFVAASAVGAFSGLQEFELYFHLDPSPFYLLGRSLSALFGTATVWLTYKIGRMLGDHRAGQISALFLAVCFLHVRDSHFLTTDVPATFYFVASCGMTLRYAKMGRTRDLYWSAALLGFAASTKYNLGLFAITVLLAGLHGSGSLPQIARRLLATVGFMAIAFIAVSPYIVLDFATFWRDFTGVRSLVHYGRRIDPGNGWWYYLQFVLPHSLGWPLLAAGLAGAVRWTLRRRLAELSLLSGLIFYFAVAGSGKGVYFRYLIPLMPLLCLGAGLLVSDIARTRLRAWTAALLIAAPTAWASYNFNGLLSQTDTRLLAARWIEQHVAAGAKIARCCSRSLYGHPQLRLSLGAAEQRKAELSRAGYSYRRWRYLQAIEEQASRPGYDLVELIRGDDSGYSWTWSQYDLNRLRRERVEWVVVHEYPHLNYSHSDPSLAAQLQGYAVKTFDPLTGAATPIYDRNDAFYLAVAGFGGLSRPGPKISIYRIDIQ